MTNKPDFEWEYDSSQIVTKADFAKFLSRLAEDFRQNSKIGSEWGSGPWENITLDTFFEAMEAFVLSQFINEDEASLNWKQIADLFLAAKVLE